MIPHLLISVATDYDVGGILYFQTVFSRFTQAEHIDATSQDAEKYKKRYELSNNDRQNLLTIKSQLQSLAIDMLKKDRETKNAKIKCHINCFKKFSQTLIKRALENVSEKTSQNKRKEKILSKSQETKKFNFG